MPVACLDAVRLGRDRDPRHARERNTEARDGKAQTDRCFPIRHVRPPDAEFRADPTKLITMFPQGEPIMPRPYVICHMTSSVDGRIKSRRWSRGGDAGEGAYEAVHQKLAGDA